MSDFVLVEIRCGAHGCGKLLATVTSHPTDWTGELRVAPCPKHGGNRGGWRKLRESRRRMGESAPYQLTVARLIPWADLRASVEDARRVGRTIVVRVM